ncbi:hypothetical protein [Corynebacterium uterequi]|uniref:Precorrin-3B synthase n=1 Tax=Corynebacterium uterequi TaxID=1072256 RepID=A0A0G3HCN0_9CORY|nr:hypothetical protein [Corynebacterium uterequi]AKK11074.1 hypothetical protein CUTER_05385 [Corynebacterium uterequi]
MTDDACLPRPHYVPGPSFSAEAWASLAAAAAEGDGVVYVTNAGALVVRTAAPVAKSCEREDLVPADDEDASSTGPELVGWEDRADGLVDVGFIPPLGMVSAKVAQLVAVLEAPVSVTASRGLILHGLQPGHAEAAVRVLAPLGVSFDADTPWTRVSACVGRRGCAAARSDVHADAAELARVGGSERTHVVGCELACGRPSVAHVEYAATGEGDYEVTTRSAGRGRVDL